MAQVQGGNTSAEGVYVSTTSDDWSEPYAESSTAAYVNASARSERANFTQGDRAASDRPQGPAFDLQGSIQGMIGRILLALAGIVLILVGIPMLILPGPGLLAIVAGIACLGKAVGFAPKYKVRA